VIPANHGIAKDALVSKQIVTKLGVVIEDDVWIGAGAKILDGVTLRKGSVIGAGAVVTKSTESYGVYAGVPAKLIKFRK
jgi:acetyltransferase-like isoleucine patch superfamily enzyme